LASGRRPAQTGQPGAAGAFRIDFIEGKIRSIKSYWDTAAMARQLGLMS